MLHAEGRAGASRFVTSRSRWGTRRMDSLEVNKTIAAVLVAGIAFMVTGFISEILVHPRELEKPAIQIAGAPAETAPTAQPEANRCAAAIRN